MKLLPSRKKEEKKPAVEVKEVSEAKPQPSRETNEVKQKVPVVETFEVSTQIVTSNGDVKGAPKLITDKPLDVIVPQLSGLNFGLGKDEISSVIVSIQVVMKEAD